MKKITFLLLAATIMVGIMSCGKEEVKDTLPEFVKNDMELVWSDEFDQHSDEPNPEATLNRKNTAALSGEFFLEDRCRSDKERV